MQIIDKILTLSTQAKERNKIDEIMQYYNSGVVRNQRIKKIHNVIMVVPLISPYAGGVTSALRILTYIQKKGCKVTMAYYAPNASQSDMENNAKKCIQDFQGSVKKVQDCYNEEYDICIATSWESVFYSKNISGYKVYFVQDYEPEFFESNDLSALAKQTYKLGYHIISLGEWNTIKIKKNISEINSEIDYVDFPYDNKEYTNSHRDYSVYKDKKNINIACYIKYTGRRIPYLCEYILRSTKKELLSKGIDLNIFFYGINKYQRFSYATNLGRLTRSELSDLYKKCDFGMVASMSNISLVPYEMLATGLPVIEFKDGSYSFFLGEDTALLIDFDYTTLVDKIISVLDNPSILEDMNIAAQKRISAVSWEKTCEQFWHILEKSALFTE